MTVPSKHKYKKKNLTATQWANIQGLSVPAMYARLSRLSKGEITAKECFDNPPDTKVNDSNWKGMGCRARNHRLKDIPAPGKYDYL